MYSLCESHRNLHRNTAPGEEALVDILAINTALTSPFQDSWAAASSLGRHHASGMEACYVWLLLFYTSEPLPTIDFQLVGILSHRETQEWITKFHQSHFSFKWTRPLIVNMSFCVWKLMPASMRTVPLFGEWERATDAEQDISHNKHQDNIMLRMMGGLWLWYKVTSLPDDWIKLKEIPVHLRAFFVRQMDKRRTALEKWSKDGP